MLICLTSACGGARMEGGKRIPSSFDPRNGLLDVLSRHWTPRARGLLIASDPAAHRWNDDMQALFRESLRLSGLDAACFEVCDSRHPERAADMSRWDYVMLAGGHVPTQNAFFQALGLREGLRRFQGVLMGVSAGSMNAAETVYAQPELEGESLDPGFRRFLPGLGLTPYMLLPHYNETKDYYLDGRRLYEDITFADSMGHRFYVLSDGSFLLVEDGRCTLRGEARLIEDGRMRQISREGDVLPLP